MRRVFLFVITAILAGAALGAPAAEGPSPAEKGLPKLSGFHRVRELGPDSAVGIGSLSGVSCRIGASGQPAAYAGNMLLDCDGEIPHNETSIAVDPGNPDHAIGAFHSYQVSFNGSTVIARIASAISVTTDGGLNWREMIPAIQPFQFTGDPSVAIDSQGVAYLASIADHEGPGNSFTGPGVVVARSSDGGETWDPFVTVAKGAGAVNKASGSGTLLFNDKAYLTIDTQPGSPHRDRLYVTWSQAAQRFQRRDFFLKVPIVISFSDDGDHWSLPIAVSGSSLDLCPGQISGAPGECDLDQISYPTVAPGGRVYVGFENFNTFGLNQYLVVSSADGGATWSPPSRVDRIQDNAFPINVDGDITLSGCQFRYTATSNVAADPSDPTGNTLVATWADDRNFVCDPATNLCKTNVDVFLGRSRDGGRTWRVFPVDTSPNDQFFPWVAVAPDGRVDVAYMDRGYSAGQEECRYGFSLTRINFDGSGQVASSAKSRMDTGISDPGNSLWLGTNTRFIGDYTGAAVDSTGRTWGLWTDMRAPAGPTDPRRGQHAVGALAP